MPMPRYEESELLEAVAAYEAHGGVKADAARALGLKRNTFVDRLNAAEKRLGIRIGKVAGGKVHGIEPEVRPLPKRGKVRRYVLTCAQNNTHINTGVWQNLLALASHYGAEVLVGTFSYNKSAYGKYSVKRGKQHSKAEASDWYDPELAPYIVDRRVELAPGLVWCGEMNILPTAEDPLSGLETYTGRKSAVFPHVKIEMRSVASAKYEPTKFNYTTGTVTLRNYIQKKAGLKAEFHHVYGAALAEVDHNGAWWVRQLNADGDDGIQDLTLYAQLGQVTDGHSVEGITWGDLHEEQMDPEVRQIAWGKGGVLDTLRSKYQFMHDTLAVSCGISHHDLKSPLKRFKRYSQGRDSVQREVNGTAAFLSSESFREWCRSVVVDSNHDRHLTGWIEHASHKDDNVNAVFYLRTALALYEALERNDSEFHLVEHVMREAGVPETVTFLRQDESFIICRDASGGIECGMHGDEGPNGSRGTPRGLSRLGRKTNIGDKHSAEIRHGCYVAGTSSLLDLEYNTGPGSWSHTFTVTYPNGKRTLVTVWAGKAWA